MPNRMTSLGSPGSSTAGAQTRGTGIAWVWAEDYGGLRPFSAFAGMPLDMKIAAAGARPGPLHFPIGGQVPGPARVSRKWWRVASRSSQRLVSAVAVVPARIIPLPASSMARRS